MRRTSLSLFWSLSSQMPSCLTTFPGDGLGRAARAASPVLGPTPDLGSAGPAPPANGALTHRVAIIPCLIGLTCAIFFICSSPIS